MFKKTKKTSKEIKKEVPDFPDEFFRKKVFYLIKNNQLSEPIKDTGGYHFGGQIFQPGIKDIKETKAYKQWLAELELESALGKVVNAKKQLDKVMFDPLDD